MIKILGLAVLLRIVVTAEKFTCSIFCEQGPYNRSLTCNTTTGECIYGCKVSFAGPNCSYECPQKCLYLPKNETRTCNITSGECMYGCNVGYAGPKCSVKCPENCVTYNDGADICNVTTEECLFGCKDGFYGSNCSESCSDVVRYCEKCEARYDYTGIECQRCHSGFYLSAGKCLSCNYFCLLNVTSSEPTCRQEDGYCNQGCRPGRYGFMCGERCSATCKDVCHRNTGTCSDCKFLSYCGPTCEVSCQDGCLLNQCNQSCQCVQGCNVNYWGDKCLHVCNVNCIKSTETTKRTCDEADGTCILGCSGERYWGNQCNKSCPSSCVNGTCDQYSGNCTDGCTSNTVYGWRCDAQCYKNCRDGTCNRADGYCDKGCIDGAYGITCDKDCSPGCNRSTCNRHIGQCEYGCKDGYYGKQCDNICSATCLNKICNMVDGSCPDESISRNDEIKTKRETENNDDLLLGLAVSGWLLFAILLTFVIVKVLKRSLMLKVCDNNENRPEPETQPQIANQQMYTTLQHEQIDVTKYEMLNFGKEKSAEETNYENSGF